MQGPEQLPSEGDMIKTWVGSGLSNPTKVQANVRGVYDDQVLIEVTETLEEGDVEPSIGEKFGADPDGFLWER